MDKTTTKLLEILDVIEEANAMNYHLHKNRDLWLFAKELVSKTYKNAKCIYFYIDYIEQVMSENAYIMYDVASIDYFDVDADADAVDIDGKYIHFPRNEAQYILENLKYDILPNIKIYFQNGVCL